MLPRRLNNGVGYASTGAMSNRVSVLQRSQARDATTGEFLTTHELVATVWAKIDMLATKYIERPEQVTTEATHKVTIRYMSGITTANLIQFDNRVFNIEAVFDPDERKRELHLMCYERNDGK